MQELSGISEAARDLAMSRFRLIQPYLEQKRSLQLVAADAKIPLRTAQRWVSQYRKLGLVALVRKPREDRGARRVVSAKIKTVIEGLALERPPLPIRSICRQVRQFAEATGEVPPRYGTVYDLVREIPSGLLTLAQRGSKAYSEEFDLVHRREAPRSNAIWQADHAQLSILLLRENGETSRPWLTIVIDDYSRAIAGYYLGFDPPSSLRTALALRQGIVLDPMRREAAVVLEEIRVEDEKRRREIMDRPGCSPRDRPAVDPTYFETYKHYQAKERAVSDPTTLILVDEADRLQMNSLEQMRSIFDEGTAGMVLIGMPGIEKRVARFPQFYSRIGFVHEFRPLDATQMQELLEKRWTPAGVTLPDQPLVPEVIASLIRMTGGNFRLLTRLLTQIERVLSVNNLHLVSTAVVEAARDSLVIGPG